MKNKCDPPIRHHKFKHGLLEPLKPIFSCGLDIETTCHYLLHCLKFTNERSILLDSVSRINKDVLTSCDTTVVILLYHGDKSLDLVTNTHALNAYVTFILSSNKFDDALVHN